MPLGLRHVISGILAGGIPGFRMVLCCFSHLCVWPGVCLFSACFFLCFLVVLAILGCDDTKAAITCMNPPMNLGASHSCALGFGLFCFCCLVLCFVWFCFVCLCCLPGL